MSLPLVVSASKLHTMQVKNMRENCRQEDYLNNPQFIVSNDNPKITKASLCQNKKSKSVKKCKQKRKSKRMKNASVRLADCQTALGFYNVANARRKRNKAERYSLNTAKNQDLNNSTSVVFCSVRKIVSSYSTKPLASKPKSKSSRTNPTVTQRRPQTGNSKQVGFREREELNIKRQSCPPPLQLSNSPTHKKDRVRKVYYSEAQSQMHAGVPRAPPATPLNDILIAVEIVPCLADIKSQQTIKAKLRNLEIQRQKAKEKLRDKFLKEEKRREREQRESVKQQRRAEIYALNKVMTDHERNKFLQFMKEKATGATTVSLNV